MARSSVLNVRPVLAEFQILVLVSSLVLNVSGAQESELSSGVVK